jgi:hypothetical protein
MRKLLIAVTVLFITVFVAQFLDIEFPWSKIVSYFVLAIWAVFAVGLFMCFLLFHISEFGAFWKKNSKFS